MGAPNYRGPVETVEQAMWAHAVLHITCQRCSRSSSMWAYHLHNRRPALAALPLKQAVNGFYCKGCRRSVAVFLVAESKR